MIRMLRDATGPVIMALLLVLAGVGVSFSMVATAHPAGIDGGDPAASRIVAGGEGTGDKGPEDDDGGVGEGVRGVGDPGSGWVENDDGGLQLDEGVVSAPGFAPSPFMGSHGANEFDFECPQPSGGEGVLVGQSSFTLYGCPLRVYDAYAPGVRDLPLVNEQVTAPSVGWLFGNVQLVVDQGNPDHAAFFSLHGNPAEDGRTDNARDHLTHTAFTSANGGLTWMDQPTVGGFPVTDSVGEWASGTMDEQGRLYPAYLWNTPDGRGGHDSLLGVFWSGKPDESGSVSNSYHRGYFHEARQESNIIETAHVVHLPPMEDGDEDEDAPDPGNGTEPQEPGEIGEPAWVQNETGGIALVWFERATDVMNSTTGKSGWIDSGWTSTARPEEPREERNWTFLPDESLIGPCRGMSDPVVWEARIYVACIVERGYEARSRASVGEVDLWRIDPSTGESELLSYTGISAAEHVRMAVTPDGYFAVAGSIVESEHLVQVQVSLGWHGTQWGAAGLNIGTPLHGALGNVPLRDAHVTAVALTQETKTLFLVYKEWNDVESPVIRPDLQMPRLTDFKKVVVSLNECEFPLAGAEFHMGEMFDSLQYESWQDSPGIFNDRQDGLQTVRLPDGRERVFMAINDYGAVQYAAIAAESGSGGSACSVGSPGLPIPAAAIPQAVGMGTGAGTAVGSAVALVSLAMVAYLLAVKRRNPLASVAKDE